MRTKTFHLPLLAALPAVLAACGPGGVDTAGYNRWSYTSYQQCLDANRALLTQGLSNPCQRSGSTYFGPYIRVFNGSRQYLGYDGSGKTVAGGVTYDPVRGSYGTFRAPVSRGGFLGSSRSGSFGG
ncbi:hypothetical protein HNQ07_002649 [Deinococcus metalli]|uniref:Uncharacterized protein n=1 Tax=Deinococcus metalli TaxID=1141878 RepID=A0A7W8KHL7_9DEIO|nr:hypothetical protein [Deinococcus metalli]MBB5377176.1 hypothetical protein [Deinococcus metalli]GHF48414.1 hypothetical protein GCM10017781_25990 [Deinococcus metalli]